MLFDFWASLDLFAQIGLKYICYTAQKETPFVLFHSRKVGVGNIDPLLCLTADVL